jgi:hypothetical protein
MPCPLGLRLSTELRAALKLAVQLGRGDEVIRQAEMVNPTECRKLGLADFG